MESTLTETAPVAASGAVLENPSSKIQPKGRSRSNLDTEAVFADLGYIPHEGQWAVHRSQALRRVLAAGARWGKTTCAAYEGIVAALEPRERSTGWVVAPIYRLAEKVFREVVTVFCSRIGHRVVSLSEQEKRIVVRNMAGGLSEICARSADNPVSLLGEGLDWLVVDEAARIRHHVWESYLTQRLLDRKGWALLISTPRGKGWFYDAYRRGRGVDPYYESWSYPTWQSSLVDRALVEAERGRLPERVFREQYGAEFLEGSGAVLRHVRDRARGGWQQPTPGGVYHAGLDLARVEDYTVLTILNHAQELVFCDRFHRVDWDIQVQRVKVSLDRYNHAPVLVDSTGVGDPVFENLRRAGLRAKSYPFTQRSKAALIDNLALLFERGTITIPDPDVWPEGIDELEAFEYTVREDGGVSTGAPSGAHDDIVCSLALAAWEFRSRSSGSSGLGPITIG